MGSIIVEAMLLGLICTLLIPKRVGIARVVAKRQKPRTSSVVAVGRRSGLRISAFGRGVPCSDQ